MQKHQMDYYYFYCRRICSYIPKNMLLAPGLGITKQKNHRLTNSRGLKPRGLVSGPSPLAGFLEKPPGENRGIAGLARLRPRAQHPAGSEETGCGLRAQRCFAVCAVHKLLSKARDAQGWLPTRDGG